MGTKATNSSSVRFDGFAGFGGFARIAGFAALLAWVALPACKSAARDETRALAPVDAGSTPPAARTTAPAAATPAPVLVSAVRTTPKGQLARFPRGVVSSANPVASEEAARILAAGGSAMDAAITCALVLGVVEPHSAGIGGGGFLLHYEAKTKEVRALDYRERAPRKATRDLYRRDGGVEQRLAVDGHLAVGVPGTIAGLFEAHRKFGKLPWSRLVEPAARAADAGYIVEPRVAEVIALRAKVLRRYPASVREFMPDGKPPAAGTRLRHPELARTLRTIGASGPAPFYEGALARAIVAESTRGGGILELDDLKAYRPLWRTPVRASFKYREREVELVSMPPPSSGGVHLLQILNVLAGDPLDKLAPDARAHLVIEAMRRAYADRAQHLGDPDFVTVPARGLMSPDYAKVLRAGIDPKRATPSSKVRPGAPARYESPQTTHLSVIDAAGNAVSLTQSINYGMGAAVVVPGTGILLNDTMDDFSVAPGTPNAYGLLGGEANAIAARKTPLSSMTPTLVLRDGKLWLAVGSPGGSTIITTVLHVVLGRVALGLDLAAAVGAARYHHQWMPDRVSLEESRPFGAGLAAKLRARGHDVRPVPKLGNVHAVELAPDGTRLGAADPRGDGACAGH